MSRSASTARSRSSRPSPDDHPADVPDHPADVPDRPADVPDRPADVPDRPADVPDRPADVAVRPADVAVRPADVPDRPAARSRTSREFGGQRDRNPERSVRQTTRQGGDDPVQTCDHPPTFPTSIRPGPGIAHPAGAGQSGVLDRLEQEHRDLP